MRCFGKRQQEQLTLGSDFVFFSISGSVFFDFLLFDFPGLFCLAMKPSKLKGPKAPNDERLIVAADADKGWNPKVGASVAGCGCWISEVRFSANGTTPSRPWKRRNAFSKPGPSSKIGPRTALVYNQKRQKERGLEI
jgi:hypothetical protein